MVDIIWGTSEEKPVSSKTLADFFIEKSDIEGYLYLGYPIINTPNGPLKLDALLISPNIGLVAFDLVEGLEIGDYEERQDQIANMLEVRLKVHSDLSARRKLRFPINVVTFASAKKNISFEEPYYLANYSSLNRVIEGFKWEETVDIYKKLLSAIQVVSSIRSGKNKREIFKKDSRGDKLKSIENSIANLDQRQSEAVIETVDGVQRIRGLAGSGKTIVLALKVAYLHSQNPEWRIAVTFNTRSLKEQFRRLINNFTIEQSGIEPDWNNIDIINAWGGPGDEDNEGVYHKFCSVNGISFYDFSTAKRRFGDGKEFLGACSQAISDANNPVEYYDLILIDEAQDLPNDFLRLCYKFLKSPKRLVYAYDELQSLTGGSMAPPEEIFGKDAKGKPLVELYSDDNGPRKDIILEKCYRNSAPVLATAHALGFGIYREKGLIQIFDSDELWRDVGYEIQKGEIKPGERVVFKRTSESSPEFLANHSDIDDLIKFIKFDSVEEQNNYLIENIKNNISYDELRPEDIVVINPNPLTTQKNVAPIRRDLFSAGVNSELAGVSTSADIFYKQGSVTFTGIFRAKGNEAGMVYIINAQDCASGWDPTATAIARNRLFTAITRSKAWVRVLGIGANMDILINEFQSLKHNNFMLEFNYPTNEEKARLKIINKDAISKSSRRKKLKLDRDRLLNAMINDEVDIEQLLYDFKKAKEIKGRS